LDFTTLSGFTFTGPGNDLGRVSARRRGIIHCMTGSNTLKVKVNISAVKETVKGKYTLTEAVVGSGDSECRPG
jgi:hypothetical protein